MKQLTATELSSLAYDRVKAMIRNGDLTPGQKIVQERLAGQLGISRTPLRSALRRLEGDNLVTSVPRRGMFVRRYTEEEINYIYDCRIALEATAARRCAEYGGAKLADKLAAVFAPFSGQMEINPVIYQKADARFHTLLMEECGNPFLLRMYQQGNVPICLDMIGLLREPRETLPEHGKIIEAIRRGDGEAAEALTRHHLAATQKLLQDG